MCDCGVFLAFVISIFSLLIIKVNFKKRSKNVFNIYRTPTSTYWIKTIFMFVILTYRRLVRKPLDHQEIEANEHPKKLRDGKKAVDAVYFNAASRTGSFLVVGLARRPEKLVDGYMFLDVAESGLGLLETPKMPRTELYQSDNELGTFAAEGLAATVIVPMEKWKVSYTGLMKSNADPKKTYQVELNAEFVSKIPHFNYETDADDLTIAKSIAMQPWSRDYFKNLEKLHQTHYEQFGDIVGTVTIDGKTYELNVNGMRDHTVGAVRNWSDLHRYALHFCTMENGDRIAVGIVCMPTLFSRYLLGYMYKAKENKNYALQDCDLELYKHGENKMPPMNYAFSFKAGGETHLMSVQVVKSAEILISKDDECIVFTRQMTCNIDGVHGWGENEWEYRNI